MMLEYEKKLPFTEDEYNEILENRGQHKPCFRQTNYYYDSNDLKMNKQGITCRIREKNGQYEATIKAHKQGNEDCSIEKTKDAKNQYDDSLFLGMHLKLQGSLITERTILYSNAGYNVFLDKNTYLGITDYEMEVEYPPGCEDQAHKLIYDYIYFVYPLKEWLCTLKKREIKSKSERFFERKRQENL